MDLSIKKDLLMIFNKISSLTCHWVRQRLSNIEISNFLIIMLKQTPVLWPPDVKSWLIWKNPDSGKDWRQEEKWTTEDEMVGWHHWLNGPEFGWTPGVGDGQGGLACCSPWGHKESDLTERLNWIELNWTECLTCKNAEIIVNMDAKQLLHCSVAPHGREIF